MPFFTVYCKNESKNHLGSLFLNKKYYHWIIKEFNNDIKITIGIRLNIFGASDNFWVFAKHPRDAWIWIIIIWIKIKTMLNVRLPFHITYLFDAANANLVFLFSLRLFTVHSYPKVIHIYIFWLWYALKMLRRLEISYSAKMCLICL